MDKQTWESMTPEQQHDAWIRYQQWQPPRHRAATPSEIPLQRAGTRANQTQQPAGRRRRWPWAILVGAVALVAGVSVALATDRSADTANSAASTSPTASTPTAEEAFVADVLDTPGLTSTISEQSMIDLGWGACDVMAFQAYSREDFVAEFGTTKFGPEVAAVMIDAAHRNLCPQYEFPLVSSAAPVNAGDTSTSGTSGPATSASDGTYEVGVDVEEGRYKTTGPEPGARSCYQARLSDDTGDSSSIIANDLSDGPTSVTVKAGEFIKFNGGCTWTKQD
ncbi:hypothetical protein GCM10009613_24840 [Pseudonocardia kongjuensis]|uniref:DUF732 domain-containing protein n=1 Tax=Pseudonocardia kongjuensis TaxID=102227 RepID=A0ABN1XS48_9PSEU